MKGACHVMKIVDGPEECGSVELEELGAVSNCKIAARRERHIQKELGSENRKLASGDNIAVFARLKFHFNVSKWFQVEAA